MKPEMYIAPTADWILLAPAEDLMTGGMASDDSFALKQWGDSSSTFDASISGGGEEWGRD